MDDENGNVLVGMMVRAASWCLPARVSTRLSWKYEDERYECGELELEKHYVVKL